MNDDGPTRRAEEALLGLLAETPFRDVRLAEVATRAGVPLADLRRAYEGPLDILSGFTRRIDVAVLEGDDPAMAGEPIKDRLLDALMRRYDLLAPHRPGLEGLARSARRDPVLAVHLARLLIGSQAWILEASGVSANGPYGAAKAAMIGLMNVLHIEGAKYDIRVNALAPTAATQMTAGLLSDEAAALLTPESVTPAVLYLVGKDAPSRVVMGAGGGVFAVTRILESEGVYLPESERTPEGIARHFAEISDLAGARTLDGAFDQTGKFARIAAQALNLEIAGRGH